MNRILTLAGTVLITATLAACSPGINLLGHRITFDSSGMVVHAPGQPNAHVSRDGDLSIDGKVIAVTPAERLLLQRYYQQAHATMTVGETMGAHGVAMAERGIGDAISSIFHHGSSTADKRMEAESQKIETEANALCANVKSLGATEEAIAAELPAFAPYAGSDHMQCKVTHTVTYRADGITTSTYSLHAGNGPDTRAASAPATTPSGKPGLPVSSRP